MTDQPLPLIVGIPGPELLEDQRRVLERVRPQGIILFARNIRTAPQLRDLVGSLRELDPEPLLAVDLEGGAVNRLTPLWGTLPSPATAASVGRRAVAALGEAAGTAARAAGIQLVLAPVVDLATENGLLARQQRCLAAEPDRVVALGEVFLEKLRDWGVAGCLKHYPGLGAAVEDSHEVLPSIELDADAMASHLAPFTELAGAAPAVMVAHVRTPALGDGEHPASLDPRIIDGAAQLPTGPVVLTDDLDMKATAAFGSLEETVIEALHAGAHGVLACRSWDALPELAAGVRDAAEHDPTLGTRLRQAATRLGTLAQQLRRDAEALPTADDDAVAAAWDRARAEADT